MIVTFIPAAGQSSRMQGRDKLLEIVRGKPILRQTALTAKSAKLGPVIVGLRPNDRPRRKALRNLEVDILDIVDADKGMSATLRAGAAEALSRIMAYHEDDYEYSGMAIMLPDMPEITAEDLIEMDRAFQSSGGPAVRATTADGKFGHPNIFPAHILRDFELLHGDRGAAELFQAERVVHVPLSGDRARLDLDTPEAWAAWRAKTNTPH